MQFNADARREMTKALQAYMLVSARKDIVKNLLDQLNQDQNESLKIDRSLLPTIGYGVSAENNEDEWNQSFCQLQRGNIGMICGIGKQGENLQVTFDDKDQAYILTGDNQLIMFNQNLAIVKHKFQSMFA